MKTNCILLVYERNEGKDITYFLNKMDISKDVYGAADGKDALRFVLDYSGRNEGFSPELIILDPACSAIEQHNFLDIYDSVYFPNKKSCVVVILDRVPSEEYFRKYPLIDFKLIVSEPPLTVEKVLGFCHQRQTIN